MKFILFVCFFAVSVYGHPAKYSDLFDNSEESFFLLPLSRHHKDTKKVPSVVEVEVGESDEDESSSSFLPTYFRPLFFNPFSLINFGFSDFFSKPFSVDSFMPKDIPNSKVKNSTSTTKVVDGHKITVNDTIYENEKSGAVYRFQVVEILPADSHETKDKDSGEKTDTKINSTTDSKTEVSPTQGPVTRTVTEGTKPDQNSEDNEINREEILPRYELQGEYPAVFDSTVKPMIDVRKHFVTRSINSDLSSDIVINQVLSENIQRGALFMIPPEVEVFDTANYDQVSGNYQQQEPVNPYENQATIPPQF